MCERPYRSWPASTPSMAGIATARFLASGTTSNYRLLAKGIGHPVSLRIRVEASSNRPSTPLAALGIRLFIHFGIYELFPIRHIGGFNNFKFGQELVLFVDTLLVDLRGEGLIGDGAALNFFADA